MGSCCSAEWGDMIRTVLDVLILTCRATSGRINVDSVAESLASIMPAGKRTSIYRENS